MSHPPLAHDAVWVRQLAAELAARGYPANQLLAKVGLDEEKLNAEDARIPFAKHAAFFELATETVGDRCLGLHFGKTRDTRDAGLLGYVGLSSPTLLDAIRSLCRYRRVFSDAAEFNIDGFETNGRLRWWFHGLGRDLPRQCLEFTSVNLVRAFREICARHIVPASVSFVHSRNDDIDAFESFFGCTVIFGDSENVIELKPSDLGLTLVDADDRLLRLLRRCCQKVLSQHPGEAPPLVDRVERLIANSLASNKANFADIATELGMSQRSLSRKLAEAGTSYRSIVENLRKELALRYLEEDQISSTEVAFLLGYNETSTLSHAFRRWTGMTTTQFRKKHNQKHSGGGLAAS